MRSHMKIGRPDGGGATPGSAADRSPAPRAGSGPIAAAFLATLALGFLGRTSVGDEATPPATAVPVAPQGEAPKPPETPPAPPAEAQAGAEKAVAGEGAEGEGAEPGTGGYSRSDDIIRNQDGTLTWLYYTNHIGASQLKASILTLGLAGVKADTRNRDTFQIPYDGGRSRSNPAAPARKVEPDENLLILTFPAAYREVLREFLDLFDIPEPQVFIKAKVVEVTLDQNLEYGVSLFFDRSTATSGNPSTFFQGARTSFRPNSFTSPFLSPLNTGVGLLFEDLGMDEGTLVAQIEALRERGAANILSEPSILATQGQLATLITGQETPISEVVLSGGSTERITTKFKETGIRLDFTPLHIGRDYVKLRVRPEVSSVTGFQVVETKDSTVQNPIIAQRNAETVVTIRDGMTLVIGGLYAISEIDSKAGVPLLGDIPILGFLFSRTKKTKVKSELDFFITPHILKQRLDKSIFRPPGETERMRRAKGEEKPAARSGRP